MASEDQLSAGIAIIEGGDPTVIDMAEVDLQVKIFVIAL